MELAPHCGSGCAHGAPSAAARSRHAAQASDEIVPWLHASCGPQTAAQGAPSAHAHPLTSGSIRNGVPALSPAQHSRQAAGVVGQETPEAAGTPHVVSKIPPQISPVGQSASVRHPGSQLIPMKPSQISPAGQSSSVLHWSTSMEPRLGLHPAGGAVEPDEPDEPDEQDGSRSAASAADRKRRRTRRRRRRLAGLALSPPARASSPPARVGSAVRLVDERATSAHGRATRKDVGFIWPEAVSNGHAGGQSGWGGSDVSPHERRLDPLAESPGMPRNTRGGRRTQTREGGPCALPSSPLMTKIRRPVRLVTHRGANPLRSRAGDNAPSKAKSSRATAGRSRATAGRSRATAGRSRATVGRSRARPGDPRGPGSRRTTAPCRPFRRCRTLARCASPR
jgi:hypothetical protein